MKKMTRTATVNAALRSFLLEAIFNWSPGPFWLGLHFILQGNYAPGQA
jgi:hypothetical protein